jgi:hypothetical protein
MQTPHVDLQLLVHNNSNDRLAVIMAFKLGHITLHELEMELKRLDAILNRMLLDWSADEKIITPVLDEDLVWDGNMVLCEAQFN